MPTDDAPQPSFRPSSRPLPGQQFGQQPSAPQEGTAQPQLEPHLEPAELTDPEREAPERKIAEQEIAEQEATADPEAAPRPGPRFAPARLSPRPGGSWHWQRWYRQLSRLPGTLMVASLLLALGIVQLSFQLGNSIYRTVTWQQETRATLERVRSLQGDVKILQDAQRSASDPAYLEQLARCQGYVSKNESVVVAQSAPATPGYNCVAVRLP